jgi:DNA processing protein
VAPPADCPLHLTPESSSWPAELEAVEPPLEECWVRGRVELLQAPRKLAIVGTRSPTPYGEAQAQRFAAELARAGVLVVSGLARGIDSHAHAAALDVGPPSTLGPGGAHDPRAPGTLAVLGSGVDRPWPASELALRVAREGLLLSEFPPGQAPRRHHFPLRNRLIAGLSQGVLVVEAAYGSGSLITARWAADQGRAVFALPGRVDQPMARGCHRLLREGAQLVESPAELAAELGWDLGPHAGREAPSPAPAHGADPLLAALVGETLDADELALRVGRGLSEVLATLVQHELDGRVARCPGGLWRLARAREPPPPAMKAGQGSTEANTRSRSSITPATAALEAR